MTMVCKICSDSNRLAVDREIVAGGNLSKIAKEYNVPYGSLYNHAQEHLSRQLVGAYEKKSLVESMDLLAMIEGILEKAGQIFDRNFEKKRDALALKALSEQRSTIELLAKIASFLHQARALELQAQETAEEFPLATSEDLAVFTDEELKLMVSMGMKLQKDPSLVIEGRTRRSVPPPYMESPTYDKPTPEDYAREEEEFVIEDEPHEEPEPEPEPTPTRMRRTKFPESELKVREIEPTRLEPYSEKPISAASLDRRSRAEARARAREESR